MLGSSCPRCGADAPTSLVCATCGRAVDSAEAARQEAYLAFALAELSRADDADLRAALTAARVRAEAARTMLDAPEPATAHEAADATPAPHANADDDPAAPPVPAASEDAESTSPKPNAAHTGSGAQSAAPPASNERVRPRPTPAPLSPPLSWSPAEARAQFERRLELGGWFVGALFAVGGSLWATNLFWQDIPAALRPVVVGGGLAAFAAAFMATGAMLAVRHRDSLAGHVLGLVGRLIGVSATIPLAMLAHDNLGLAVVADAAVLTGLWTSLRFAAQKAGDTDGADDARAYLVAVALALVAPKAPWLAIPFTAGALLWARFAIGARTVAALAGAPSFVHDTSVIAATLVTIAGAVVRTRPELGGAAEDAFAATSVLAVVELLARLCEQRSGLFGLRMLARWGLLLWAGATAIALGDGVRRAGPLGAAFALVLVFLSLRIPARLGLHSAFRLVGVGAAAIAVALIVDVAPLPGDVRDGLRLAAALLVMFALTRAERRAPPEQVTPFGQAASGIAWVGCIIVGAVALDDSLWGVPAAIVATAIVVTDRRLERSVSYALFAVFAGLVPVWGVANELIARAKRPLAVAIMLAALAVGLAAVRRSRAFAARLRWPTLPLSTAATWWTFAFGTLCALTAASDARDAVPAAVVCALAVLIVAELSRQHAAAVAGFSVGAVLGIDGLGRAELGLHAGGTLAIVAAALASIAMVPPSGVGAARALASRWSWLGRGRFARPFGAHSVGTVMAVGALVWRVSMMWTERGPRDVAMTAATAFACALLALRRPTRGQWALALVALVVVAGDALPLVVGGLPVPAAIGLGGAVGVCVVASVVVWARVRVLHTPLVRRLWRRRGRGLKARDLWWATGVTAGIASALAVAAGALSVSAAVASALWVAAGLGVGAGLCVALFCGRGEDALAALAVCGATAALGVASLAGLIDRAELPTLAAALGVVVVAASAVLGARLLFRRPRPPWLLERFPSPSALRRPAWLVLLSTAGILSLVGQSLNAADARAIAEQYGPGLVIVSVALGAAGLLVTRTRRTVPGAVVGGSIIGAAAIGADGVAHAAGWLPKSYGMSQAIVALALVALVAMLERHAGRRVLAAVGIGFGRGARTRVTELMAAVVPVLGAVALVLAVRDAPVAHELAIAIGGAALLLLLAARPSIHAARLAGVGVVLIGGGAGAALARGAGAEALRTGGLAFVVCGALVACVIGQAVLRRARLPRALSDAADVFLAQRGHILDELLAAARAAIEAVALPAALMIGALMMVDDDPGRASLLGLWVAVGATVVLSVRMAIEREQRWPAALAQGMALAIYVDLRRRTPWLDGIDGVDAIACLAFAAVFLGISWVSRAQPRGHSTARVAELYAATLPIIAAGFSAGHGSRAAVLLVSGGLYALLSRTARHARYELACGVALVVATMSSLAAQGVSDPVLYLLPVATVGTFLARRHRQRLGPTARVAAVLSHVPLYVAVAYSALLTGTFSTFALGIVLVTVGVVYSIKVRDRRSLYAAAAAGAVLVGGRLILLGLDNALLGTLLLAGAGVLLLAGMTVFTIRRDAATTAVRTARAGLASWDEQEGDDG